MLEPSHSLVNGRVHVRSVAGRSIFGAKSWLRGTGVGVTVTVAGVDLPMKVGGVTSGVYRALGTGPGDWLLAFNYASRGPAGERVEAEGVAQGLAIVDLSSGLSVMEVSGTAARDVLTKGCGLDLGPRRFAHPQCARTRLAGVAVVIDATASDAFEVYVARSLGPWLNDWLADAAGEFRSVKAHLA